MVSQVSCSIKTISGRVLDEEPYNAASLSHYSETSQLSAHCHVPER